MTHVTWGEWNCPSFNTTAGTEPLPGQHHDSNPGFCEQQSSTCMCTHRHAHMYMRMHLCDMLCLAIPESLCVQVDPYVMSVHLTSYQVHSWVCWGPDILCLAFPLLARQHPTTLMHLLIYPGSQLLPGETKELFNPHLPFQSNIS